MMNKDYNDGVREGLRLAKEICFDRSARNRKVGTVLADDRASAADSCAHYIQKAANSYKEPQEALTP